MEITEFAKKSRFPLKTLRALVRAGLIHDPLTEEELCGLRFVDKTWGNTTLLRAQIAPLTVSRRKRLLETVDLETKWERYAYSRYANLADGQSLTISLLCFEIEETFKFKPNFFQKKRLRAIRSMVQNRKSRRKASLKTSIV